MTMRTADGGRPAAEPGTSERREPVPVPTPVPADIVAAQERERRHIAFDLHDGPTQSICSALLEVELLSRLDGGGERAEQVERLRTALKAALGEMRAIVQRLRPQALDASSLNAKLESYADQVRAESGLDITLRFSGVAREITDTLQITIFRIVQEALTNAVRHAKATHASIELEWRPERTVCRIVDDGRGIQAGAGAGASTDRHGLIGMRERAELLGGTFRIQALASGGTEVRVSIPAW